METAKVNLIVNATIQQLSHCMKAILNLIGLQCLLLRDVALQRFKCWVRNGKLRISRHLKPWEIPDSSLIKHLQIQESLLTDVVKISAC